MGSHLESCLTEKLSGEFLVCFIKDPGKTLPNQTKRAIYNAFVPLTSYAFGADMTSYWRSREDGGYMENLEELVLITTLEGTIVGWTGYCLVNSNDARIIYNDSSGIIPPLQGKGVMSRLLIRRTAECQVKYCDDRSPLYFSARTESPIIYSIRKRLTERLYPSPDYETPELVGEHAAFLAHWLGQRDKFEQRSLVIRNAYAMVENLYGELPTSGDTGLDQWIRTQLGPLDAFLLMGESVRPPNAR
jgi:hypothetical protein